MNLDQRGEGYFLRASTRLDSSVYTERRDKEDTAASGLQGSHYFAIGAGQVIVELPHPLMLRIISHQHAPGGRPARSLLVLLGSATRSWRNLIKTVISGDAKFRITAAHEAVEFLSAFPRATRLKMAGTACPGELCGAFLSSSLTSLDLSGNMSISDISAVAGCVHLRELFLGSTSVSDVSALSACLRLTRLELQHTPVVTLQGLRTLSLETINLDGTRVTAFDGLGPTVRELLASGTQVAEVTEHLAKLTELRKLVLDFTNLTDVGRISRLTRLCSLSLYKTRVSNVSGLSVLVALRDLDLSETRVGSVRGLAPLLNMQKLLLYGTPLSSIHGLERMYCLEELRISVTRVSDLTPLALLASLRTLDASNSPLLGTLDGIEGCDMIEVLNLSYTAVGDVGALAGLRRLRCLELNDSLVADIASLAGLTVLEELFLSATRVAEVRPLAALTALRTLHLSNTLVRDIHALSGLTRLRTLNLNSCAHVATIDVLSRMAQLEFLFLNETRVADVSALASCSRLRKLYLHRTRVTDVSGLSLLPDLVVSQ